MDIAIKVLIGLIALIHCYILWFEMFAWETRGKKVFKNFPEELFSETKGLAANQVLYNGFLAAGLIWTFFIQNIEWQANVSLFFLTCVAIAGLYGSVTASERKILFIQTIPASIAIVLILFGNA